MTATAGKDERLAGTDGFVVESLHGDVGWVEEVWVGEANEPRALAVRTSEGRHGLLLGADVLAVDRENHWVVVSPDAVLLELDAPRLQPAEGEDGAMRQAASWTTTGEIVPLAPRERDRWRPLQRWAAMLPLTRATRLPWAVAILLTGIVLLLALMMALAFVIARIVSGSPY